MTRPAAFLALVCILETAARMAYAAPAEEEQQIKRGAQLLQQKCAPCHAIGKTGNSPRQEAPPFRTLSERYPIESLEESLGEGIMSGHPDMPEFSFDADGVGAIIAYLNSIQQSPPQK
jgi:mono/diheme cytochrome c family protein